MPKLLGIQTWVYLTPSPAKKNNNNDNDNIETLSCRVVRIRKNVCEVLNTVPGTQEAL